MMVVFEKVENPFDGHVQVVRKDYHERVLSTPLTTFANGQAQTLDDHTDADTTHDHLEFQNTRTRQRHSGQHQDGTKDLGMTAMEEQRLQPTNHHQAPFQYHHLYLRL